MLEKVSEGGVFFFVLIIESLLFISSFSLPFLCWFVFLLVVHLALVVLFFIFRPLSCSTGRPRRSACFLLVFSLSTRLSISIFFLMSSMDELVVCFFFARRFFTSFCCSFFFFFFGFFFFLLFSPVG